jgi:hypothetical protein
MGRRLSSWLTPFYKFGLPGLWLGCGAYSILDYLWSWNDPTLPNNFLPICFLYAFGAALFLWKLGPLKRVEYDGELLYISNYFQEIQLSLKEVDDVHEAGFLTNSPRRIVLVLKTPTLFGKKIEFAPSIFTVKEIVRELNEQLQKAHL